MRTKKNEVSKDKDIFDIEKIDDLPKECRKEIEKKKVISERVMKIMMLFKIKPVLNTKEIIAGMYRVNGDILTKNYLSTTLSNLVSRGLLQSPTKGYYKNVLEVPPQYKEQFNEIINKGV